jgi:hypothetical protein
VYIINAVCVRARALTCSYVRVSVRACVRACVRVQVLVEAVQAAAFPKSTENFFDFTGSRSSTARGQFARPDSISQAAGSFGGSSAGRGVGGRMDARIGGGQDHAGAAAAGIACTSDKSRGGLIATAPPSVPPNSLTCTYPCEQVSAAQQSMHAHNHTGTPRLSVHQGESFVIHHRAPSRSGVVGQEVHYQEDSQRVGVMQSCCCGGRSLPTAQTAVRAPHNQR